MLREVKIAISEELGVRRVIVLLLEVDQLFVLQRSDKLRLTSRVESVLRLLEEVLVEAVHKSVIGIGHGAFHFVVDNTLVGEAGAGVFGVFEFQTVTFLAEVEIVQIWAECHIRVDREQVAEVLGVLRREWVHSEIGARPRIHVGVQTALKHVEEGVAHWIVLRSARSQMLKNVGCAHVIVRGRPEKYSEDIVQVRGVQVEPLGASGFVLECVSFDVEVGHFFDRGDFKTVDLVTNVDVVWHSVLAPGDFYSELMSFASRSHHLGRRSLLLLHPGDRPHLRLMQ